jgi:hemerythrin
MNPTPTPQEPRPERRKTDHLYKHIDDRFDALEKLIKSGFPDGDPEEHRKVHEARIKEAKDRAEVRLAVKKSLYSSGIWLAILTLRANNDIKYYYVNRFSNSFEVEGW